MTPEVLLKLRRRVVEVDYRHGHRHAPTSLSALPIIAGIYETMDLSFDTFILSKGHSCAAMYACLEHYDGANPDVTKVHPERDDANGIAITSGSLGHGLPIAVGICYARVRCDVPGKVHVLMGDGECLEGTTWEALHLARRLKLQGRLIVHVDANGHQGADRTLDSAMAFAKDLWPLNIHLGRPGLGVPFFERDRPSATVYKITEADYAEIMEQLT